MLGSEETAGMEETIRQRRQIDIHRLSSNILILLMISEKPSRIIKMLIMVGSKLPE